MEEKLEIKTSWWNPEMNHLALQLPNGMLNEMRKRVLSGKIRNETLELDENTERMKQFFEREISRYNKRKDHLNQRNKKVSEMEIEIETLITDNEILKEENIKLKESYKTLEMEAFKTRSIIEKLIENYGVEGVKKMVGRKQNMSEDE